MVDLEKADTNLFVLVEGVDDELHHPVHFSLEHMLFRFLTDFLDLSCVQAIKLDGLLFPG